MYSNFGILSNYISIFGTEKNNEEHYINRRGKKRKGMENQAENKGY